MTYDRDEDAGNAVTTLNGALFEGRTLQVERSTRTIKRSPVEVKSASTSILIIGLPANFDENLLVKAFYRERLSSATRRYPPSPPISASFPDCGTILRVSVGRSISRVCFSDQASVSLAIAMSGRAFHGYRLAIQIELTPSLVDSTAVPVPLIDHRLDVSSSSTLLASLRRSIPGHLKTAVDVATHMPLLVVKLLSGVTLCDACSACELPQESVNVVDMMERRESVLGTSTAFTKRAAAAGVVGLHAKEHDAIVAHQSAPGGETALSTCGSSDQRNDTDCVLQVASLRF